MQTIKPSLARGTRDFGPALMAKRKYIFNIIEGVFRQYGYQPLETPAMENLSTLTGKYGEEGDRLIFKILNSGDYLKEVSADDFENAKENQSRTFTSLVSEKALRYDLTVPLARYVSMNRHNIAFPFKRYQIQPVWRADRPQKGRYREFYQCDADVIGSDSLFNEAELISIYLAVFKKLNLNVKIKISSRKILIGICELFGVRRKEDQVKFITTLDKIDKIGYTAVAEELKQYFNHLEGFSLEDEIDLSYIHVGINQVLPNLIIRLQRLRELFDDGPQRPEIGIKGVDELTEIAKHLTSEELKNVELDHFLARGLDYYTGTILEVTLNHEDVSMGSIGGGGRYDNLTGIFGVDGLTGVGISFGAERILDVMEQLNLFPETVQRSSDVLLYIFDEAQFGYASALLRQLRAAGMAAELYLEAGKMKKAFSYAEAKSIPYLALIGDQEAAGQAVMLKDIRSGQQSSVAINQLAQHLKNAL